MKTLRNLFIALVTLGLILSSCHKEFTENDENTVHGTGPLISQNVSVGTFSKISLTGQAKITITYGETQSVTVRAQQNIFEVLDIHVLGNSLSIGTEDNTNIQSQEGIFVDIVCPQVIVDASIVGAGDVTISGKSQESFVATITGAGNIDATNLQVSNCSIVITGAGNAYVNVTDQLTVVISGAGMVTYKGHPLVTQTIAGVGSVKDGN